MIKPISIKAKSLPDAWFNAVYNILDYGRRFKIDRGSYAGQERLEFDFFTCQIENPHLRDVDGRPLVPEMPEGSTLPPPVEKNYIDQYWQYLMTSEKQPGEQYTYGERLNGSVIYGPYSRSRYIDATDAHSFDPTGKFFSQVKMAIWTYKNKGPRNNQMILQVGQPTDMLLEDPPCLRHIDTRIQDGALHFFPYFRSWDLWNGFPANLAGISVLQEYMAAEIGVEQGDMIVSSKGLHLYDYAVELAEMRCMKTKGA